MKRAISLLITLTALCTTCLSADPSTPQKDATSQASLDHSSVVGTDFDYITESDPDTFERLETKAWDKPRCPTSRTARPHSCKRPSSSWPISTTEPALFALTLLHHPDRIPKEDAAKIAQLIPNRIAFVEKLLPKDKPLHFPVEAKQ